MIAEYACGRTGTSSPTADLAEVVAADPELLALEFDALVAANFPDLGERPDPRPPRPAARLLIRRLRPLRPSCPVRSEPPSWDDEPADADGAPARQRGPPAAMTVGVSSAEEVMP
jgi:hypothetical protein